MTALELFQTADWSVRAEMRDGEPWFVAADVCRALGIANSRDAVARLAADGVGTTDVIDSMGRTVDELAARRAEARGIHAQQTQARADVATWGLLIGRDLHGPHHDLRLELLTEAVAVHDALRAEWDAHLTLIERAS